MKDLKYSQFTYKQIETGMAFMLSELKNAPINSPIHNLFKIAWDDFVEDKFKYDGATFLSERSDLTLFEVASFIHDWRNANGFVSKEVDREFYDIMILLNYPHDMIVKRVILTRLIIGLNKLRHRFILKDLKRYTPSDLYKLPITFLNPNNHD